MWKRVWSCWCPRHRGTKMAGLCLSSESQGGIRWSVWKARNSTPMQLPRSGRWLNSAGGIISKMTKRSGYGSYSVTSRPRVNFCTTQSARLSVVGEAATPWVVLHSYPRLARGLGSVATICAPGRYWDEAETSSLHLHRVTTCKNLPSSQVRLRTRPIPSPSRSCRSRLEAVVVQRRSRGGHDTRASRRAR